MILKRNLTFDSKAVSAYIEDNCIGRIGWNNVDALFLLLVIGLRRCVFCGFGGQIIVLYLKLPFIGRAERAAPAAD